MVTISWVGRGWQWALASGIALVGVFSTWGEEHISAQIVPDDTLGAERSVVIPLDPTLDIINGGALRDANLFHSFEQFNVGEGQGAYFVNPAGIENIFSRVTGGDPSDILGRLGVLGGANLFFLNPNGIVFGENSSLDVQGAFVGTTANAVEFGQQGAFSATNPETPPLLTVNPSALLFAQLNPGGIINRARPRTVPQQGSRFLVGGDITFDGGVVSANGNRLGLGGLTGVGAVELTGSGNELQLNFPENVPRADIVLQNQAFGFTTGGGAITVHARNLTLSETSGIATSLGAGEGTAGIASGDLVINAAGTVAIDGNSFIFNVGFENSLGDTGNVEIDAESIRLTNASQINTGGERNRGSIHLNATEDVTLDSNSLISTFGRPTSIGESGDIIITARTINLSNLATINSGTFGQGRGGRAILQAEDTISLSSGSAIFSSSGASIFGGVNREPSGDIEIQARSLSLDGQNTTISSRNFDEGRSGNIQITTDDSVSLNDASLISSSTAGIGDGGDIQIQTGQLLLTNGAFIDTLTSGQGDSGNLLVDASDTIELIGSTVVTSPDGEPIVSNSRLSTSTFFSSGNAGRITLNTRRLSLQGGGAINANTGTDSTGQGGEIAIGATDAIEVVGERPDGLFSSNISTETLGSGNAGNLTLETRHLSIRDGGLVSAASIDSSGQGGNLTVNASEAVEVVGTTPDNSNFSALLAGTSGSGDAGGLTINTGRLSIRDGATVGTETASSGQGGDLTINASDLVEVAGIAPDELSSRLSASTNGDGDAGNLTINTRRLSVRDLGVVTAAVNEESTGQGGTLTINASDSVDVVGESPDGSLGSVLSTSTLSSGNAGDIIIDTQRLSVREGGFINTEARLGSTGHGGDLIIKASDFVEVVGNTPNNNEFSTYLTTSTLGSGNAGNLSIDTRRLSVRNGGLILTEADLRSTGRGGDLTINASDSVEVVSNSPDDVFNSRLSTVTGGSGDAGHLSIDTRRLSVGNGGYINTATVSSGQGGNLNINATDSVEIAGNPADTDFPDGLFATTAGSGNAGNLTLSTQRLSVRDGGTVSAAAAPGSTGRGGNLTINASDSVEVVGISNNGQLPSLLSVRSRGEGQAGNLTVNTPHLTLKDQATISAESNAVDGGNITLNVDRILLLRQNSSISATAGLAQSAGNGGNVTINAPDGFIVAIPEENSDITANAFQGNGGNVNITARGVFGLQFRPQLTSMSDITASSQFGFSGSVAVNSPDTSSLQNSLTEFPQNLIDTDNLIANSCIVRSTQEGGSFIITPGGGGLPRHPGDLFASSYTTGTVRSVPGEGEESVSGTQETRPWKIGDPIVEPQGAYRLANGELVMSRGCS